MIPVFKYYIHAQKQRDYFARILTQDILEDICMRITGHKTFLVHEMSEGYNKGRLLILEYCGVKNYITLSEQTIKGRNSSMQSVPTAMNIFYSDTNSQKQLYYYFLPIYKGIHSPNTTYHIIGCY